MLAITFGCERFHDYLYGQKIVNVESDHKPLESILKKPIYCAPARLQKMILRIQPYSLNVRYKPGNQLQIADVLSRSTQELNENEKEEFDEYEVHVLSNGGISENIYHKLVKETSKDPEMQDLYKAVMEEFRNTPITGMNESPAELLMSRKLRSRIPTGNNSLQPRISADIKKSLYRRQQDQKRFYDRATLPRKAIKLNDSIRFREGKEWHPAVVVSKHDAPRSFNILTPDGRTLRRNQYHLVTTKEQYPPYVGTDICPEVHKPPSDSKTAEVSPSQLHTSHDEAIKIEQPQIRRSTRIRRPPERYCDQY
uniref:uncharacterized protein LOC120332730 isoform X2 n=1 Tax=Styela clava TaxID=7725 RepID=UPI001939280B|nr:uncharacterized protein LOC120332730 isoform X2 [Styela clava]